MFIDLMIGIEWVERQMPLITRKRIKSWRDYVLLHNSSLGK